MPQFCSIASSAATDAGRVTGAYLQPQFGAAANVARFDAALLAMPVPNGLNPGAWRAGAN